MADNSSSNSNSWTILAPEESGVENMRPLSEEPKDQHTEHKKTDVQSEPPENLSEQPSAEAPQVAPLESSDDAAVSPGAHKKVDAAPDSPSTIENLTSLSSNQAQHEAEGHDGKVLLESDLFSDSYTHISPPPESLCTASYAEGGRGAGDEQSELSEPLTDDFRFKPDVDEAGGLRKRKVTLLSSVDRPDEDEDEEEEEKAFRPPQREGDLNFSLNKCIFGALILLGLGTILFSGVFMELDDGGESDVQEQSYTEIKKDPADVKASELLDKAAKELEQIASLQAQLQQQEEEIKATQVKLEQGTMERLRLEQLELENQKMRGELDKLPVLQKELVQEHERVKKELELLRNEVTQLSAVTPSAGQEEQVHSSQNKTQMELKEEPLNKEYKKDKKTELRGKKEWNENKVQKGKAETKEKKITEQKKWEKDASDRGHHKSEGKWEKKEKKKDASREKGKHEGDKRQVKEGKGKKEWKEDKNKQGAQYADEEKGKDWKPTRRGGKEEQHGAPKSKKEEKQWKKNGSGTPKKDKSWKQEAGHPHDGQGKKQKHREENKREQKPKKGEGPDMYKEKKEYKSKQHKGTEKWTQKNRDSTTGPHKGHSKKHIHADYWGEQREKIRHYHGPSLSCIDPSSCAHAEGLSPVHQEEFETFVSGFLNKLESSRPEIEKLDNLLDEFFLDGVFVHDQVPFGEFVEDVADILEDMAEDEEMEDEMDGFKREAMETFRLREKVGGAEKTRQSARKRGSG